MHIRSSQSKRVHIYALTSSQGHCTFYSKKKILIISEHRELNSFIIRTQMHIHTE